MIVLEHTASTSSRIWVDIIIPLFFDIDLINSEEVYQIDHDGEKREVEVVPLPFSSRLEKME